MTQQTISTSSSTLDLKPKQSLKPTIFLSQIRAGFTLLELLIVLFLLSLGYVSLYSAGLGQTTSTTENTLESLIVDTRDAIHYARKNAMASGAHVSVKLTATHLELSDIDGTPLPSPADSTQDFKVALSYPLSLNTLTLRSNETATQFFFDYRGRLVSRADDTSPMQPLRTPTTISATGYNNGDDDGAYPTSDEAFLLISNVTGELIAL